MTNTTNTATTGSTLNVFGNSTITTATGVNLTYAGGGSVWNDRSHIDDVKDYIDFTLELMGIDLDFQRFSKMTTADKQAMIREMKINKIID